MGRLVQLHARIKSAAALAAESMGVYGDLAIRLQPIGVEAVRQLGLPDGTTWAWAIVQARPGQPDALLFGGTADSQSGAEAQARSEFRKQEEQWLRQRSQKRVMA